MQIEDILIRVSLTYGENIFNNTFKILRNKRAKNVLEKDKIIKDDNQLY